MCYNRGQVTHGTRAPHSSPFSKASTPAQERSALLELNPNGLYCPTGDFYVDPLRPVRRAVLTHAHGARAHGGVSARSGSCLCTEPTAAFLRLNGGGGPIVQGVPFGEQLEIGAARVSFHPSGHILGAAQVRIEVEGEVWVVSGDFKRESDPTCEPFQVVPCEAFVTRSPFAFPLYRWPEPGQVAREIAAWWEAGRAAGAPCLLFAFSLGKTQRILAELAAAGREGVALPPTPVLLHESAVGNSDLYRERGIELLAYEELPRSTRARREGFYSGRLMIAPPSTSGPAWARRCGEGLRTALVSGEVLSGQVATRPARPAPRPPAKELPGILDRGFALSDHADWPGLIRTIEETGARRVLVTHGYSETLARFLRRNQVQVENLSEPV